MKKRLMNINQREAAILLWILFFGSVLGRFLIGNTTKNLFVYGDELLYVNIAKSIAMGRGLMVYNGGTGFDKVLYSLLLSPAFLFDSPAVISRVAQLINSVIMSLGVFPVYFLAKKMVKSPRTQIALCVLYFMGADMLFTQTFMSEILFVPLTLTILWLYYDYAINVDVKGSIIKHILMNVVIGALLTALYFTKEVGLVLIPGLITTIILTNAYVFLFKRKETDLKVQGLLLFRQMVALFVQLVVFVALRFVINKVFFSIEEGGYSVFSISAILESGRVLYLIRSILFYFSSIVVSCGVIGVLLPVLHLDSLDKKVKRFCVFLFVIMLGMSVVVCVMISMWEDYPIDINRTHLRMIGYIYIPTITVFAHLMEREQGNIKRMRVALDGVVLFTFVYLLHYLHWSAWDISGVDDNLLNYLEINNTTMERIPHLATITAVLLCVAYVVYLFKRDWLFPIFACFLIVTSSISNAKGVYEYGRYKLPDDVWEATAEVIEFEKEHPDATFYVLNGKQDMFIRARDTYDKNTNNYVFEAGQVYVLQQDGVELSFEDLNERELYYFRKGMYQYDEVKKPDYVITSGDYWMVDVPYTSEVKVNNEKQNYYKIYDVRGYDIVPKLTQMY